MQQTVNRNNILYFLFVL